MDIKMNNGNTLNVSDAIFTVDFKEALIHQIVTAYMAAARAGTKAQKTRSEVRGGGAKPFRQKGTGRARAGTIRSPIWRTGGKVFAAKPRDYEQKLNKKMYRVGMRSIFSELVRQERLIIVDDFSLESSKTKLLAAKLKEMQLDNVLILVSDFNENLFLSSRNIPNVEMHEAKFVDPVSLIHFEKVLITEAALRAIEERLA